MRRGGWVGWNELPHHQIQGNASCLLFGVPSAPSSILRKVISSFRYLYLSIDSLYQNMENNIENNMENCLLFGVPSASSSILPEVMEKVSKSKT